MAEEPLLTDEQLEKAASTLDAIRAEVRALEDLRMNLSTNPSGTLLEQYLQNILHLSRLVLDLSILLYLDHVPPVISDMYYECSNSALLRGIMSPCDDALASVEAFMRAIEPRNGLA